MFRPIKKITYITIAQQEEAPEPKHSSASPETAMDEYASQQVKPKPYYDHNSYHDI